MRLKAEILSWQRQRRDITHLANKLARLMVDEQKRLLHRRKRRAPNA